MKRTRRNKDTLPPTKPARRFQGYSVGDAAARLLSPSMRRRGFKSLPILKDWRDIVGAQIAAFSIPERLRNRPDGAVLTIAAEGAMAVEVQHLAPMILERLNAHYGNLNIVKINVVQRSITLPETTNIIPPLTEAEIAAARAEIPIDETYPQDESLLRALARLGAYIRRDLSDDIV